MKPNRRTRAGATPLIHSSTLFSTKNWAEAINNGQLGEYDVNGIVPPTAETSWELGIQDLYFVKTMPKEGYDFECLATRICERKLGRVERFVTEPNDRGEEEHLRLFIREGLPPFHWYRYHNWIVFKWGESVATDSVMIRKGSFPHQKAIYTMRIETLLSFLDLVETSLSWWGDAILYRAFMKLTAPTPLSFGIDIGVLREDKQMRALRQL